MTDLAKGTFTDHSVQVEVIEGDLGGEVDILRGSTTHGLGARTGGGLREFDWERRGIRRIKREGTLCSTRQPGETARRCKSHMVRGKQ
jgi:hypothetical protein